jgi:hypothetical protein
MARSESSRITAPIAGLSLALASVLAIAVMARADDDVAHAARRAALMRQII